MSTDPTSLKSPITPTTPAAAPPSNRASLAAPKAPKPPLSAQPTAHVGHHVHTSGTHPISVGARSVIHPYARIETARGPVEIGDGVVVWEGAVVGRAEERRGGASDGDDEEVVTTRVGNNAALEAGSIVHAGASVGEASSVGAKAVVGGGAVVGEFSTLASTTKVRAGARLEPFTVLYGTMRRSDQSLQDNLVLRDRRVKAAEAQVEMSKKLLLMAGKK